MHRLLSALALFLLPLAAIGCASPPIQTDVHSVVSNPEAFAGKRIQVTAPVAENTLSTNGHAVWRLVLGAPPETMLAYEEGVNVAILRDCASLADEAGRAGRPVSVTGILRTGAFEAHVSGVRLDMETFEYDGEIIETDYRDYEPPSVTFGWGAGWSWYW